MTLRIGNFLGPRIVEETAYGDGVGIVLSGRLLGAFNTGLIVYGAIGSAPASDSSVFWWCAEEVGVDDDGGATGDEDRILDLNTLTSGRLQVFAVRQASGDYVVRLKDDGTTLATGTTEYAYEPTYHICRITMTGSQWVVEFGGTVECNVGHTGIPTGIGAEWAFTIGGGGGGLLQYVRVQGCHYTGGDDGNDRPSTTVIVPFMRPNGEGTDDDLIPAGTNYLNWDDWSADSGSHDGDSTYNQAGITDGVAYDGTSDLDTFTITNTVRAVKHYAVFRNTDTKNPLNVQASLHDGATRVLFDHGSIITASYVYRRAISGTAPGGGAWNQTEINKLEAGMRLFNAAGSATRCTAIGVEALDLALDAGDPPPLPNVYTPRGPLRGVMKGVIRGVR
jgi:hypothetical protein